MKQQKLNIGYPIFPKIHIRVGISNKLVRQSQTGMYNRKKPPCNNNELPFFLKNSNEINNTDDKKIKLINFNNY